MVRVTGVTRTAAGCIFSITIDFKTVLAGFLLLAQTQRGPMLQGIGPR
jgi:hypothetical protein